MHIGELSRRTGLPVKTIRFYSDEGLVPEASRSASGYRRYDSSSLARLEFVRTLRDLGLDLATIRRVLDRQADLRSVAAAHADALDAQIRLLRVQRAALRALAGRSGPREPTPAEVDRMNRIAQATAEERRRAVAEFLDSIFDLGDGPVTNEFTDMMRRVTPELPDEPSEEQLDAWLELAELIRDEGFRERLRAMGRGSFGSGADSGSGSDSGSGLGSGSGSGGVAGPASAAAELAALATARAGAAVGAGVVPGDPAAVPVVAELVGAYAAAAGRTDTPDYRRELLAALEVAAEPRAERYWQLMAVINGWPPIPATMHLWDWFIAALRHADADRGL
jgi:DNA-binding transcriptional MerR regulator